MAAVHCSARRVRHVGFRHPSWHTGHAHQTGPPSGNLMSVDFQLQVELAMTLTTCLARVGGGLCMIWTLRDSRCPPRPAGGSRGGTSRALDPLTTGTLPHFTATQMVHELCRDVSVWQASCAVQQCRATAHALPWTAVESGLAAPWPSSIRLSGLLCLVSCLWPDLALLWIHLWPSPHTRALATTGLASAASKM